MRVELTDEQAVHLVKDQGYVVAHSPRISRTTRCVTVVVMGDGGPRPVRIHRASDGGYRTTLDGVTHSNDPAIAKRVLRAKRARRNGPEPR
jgi:hypothetical protein